MAIAAKAPHSILRDLECYICLQIQTTPRQLPCSHTLCENCIQIIIDKQLEVKNDTFTCTRCTRVIPIPEHGASEFPLNYFLKKMTDRTSESGNVFCHVCGLKGAEVEAESTCVQCDHDLCKKCSDIHRETGITFDHQVVNLREAVAGRHFETFRRHQQSYCPNHPEKLIELYCNDCEIPVCVTCLPLRHSQHKLQSLEEVASYKISVVQSLIPKWKDAVGYVQLLSDETKFTLDDLSPTTLENMIKRVSNIFDDHQQKIVAAVQTKKEESITKLKEQFTSARNEAQAAYEDVEWRKEILASTLESAKRLTENTHAAETTLEFPALKEKLESLDIGLLQTSVDKTTFIFPPSELPMPDLSFNVRVKRDSHYISPDFWQHQILSESQASGCHVREEGSQREEGKLEEEGKEVEEDEQEEEEEEEDEEEKQPILIRKFSSRLQGEGVSGCLGLSLGVNEYLVADRANKCVKVFDVNTTSFKVALRDKLQNPRDVTSNRKGEIFVTDCTIHGVLKYEAKTGHLLKDYPGMFKDWACLTCSEDHLIISDTLGERVLFTTFDCDPCHQIDTDSLKIDNFKPRYICIDHTTGHLVTRLYHPSDKWYRIDCINSPVKIVNTYRDDLDDPYGVCVDDLGNILVADRHNHQVILHNGTKARVLLSHEHVEFPTGLCIPGPGLVSVVEYSSGEVKTFQYMDAKGGK